MRDLEVVDCRRASRVKPVRTDRRRGSALIAQLAAIAASAREAKQTHAASLQELHGRHRSRGEAHLGVKQGIRPEKLEQTGWGVILPATKQGTPEAALQREILEALKPLLDWRREQATRSHEKYFQIFQGRRGYIPGESKQKYLARLGTGPGPADPEQGTPSRFAYLDLTLTCALPSTGRPVTQSLSRIVHSTPR